jgi:lysozyme family protein
MNGRDWFDESFEFVIEHEGGYNNVANDKGGATNYGISLRFLRLADEDLNGDGHVNEDDIKSLDLQEAKRLYRKYFWGHYRLEDVNDLVIARKCFDLFVNMRGKSAAKIIQMAVADCGYSIVTDGILGTRSFNLLNCASKRNKNELLDKIRERQAEKYRSIVSKDATQQKFLKGWLKRASA